MSFFNFGGDFFDTPPPKRPLNAKSPTIPFCTSPSQLQEVTLDQDVSFSNTMGLRSPGGPMRGRSVKEIEEQLSSLKKENFNLKLRIYFLEEKMGAHFTLDKDNIVKKYIELQVEYGNLQKELDEKHDLLCQAVKAMELEEEEHKKYVTSKEDQLNVCQQELEDLRLQLQDAKFDSDGISLKSDTTGFYSNRALNGGYSVSELQEKVKMLESELRTEKETNASLQFVVAHAETLKTRYETALKETRAKDATIHNLHEELEASNAQTTSYAAQLADARTELERLRRDHDAAAKKLRAESRRLDEAVAQAAELRRKYAAARGEAAALEEEARRQRQQAVVSGAASSPAHPSRVSVEAAAAAAGGAEADAPDVRVEGREWRAKVLRLRREQFKACEIIKNMMAARGKANEETARLREQVKQLEKELESVVSRPGGGEATRRGGGGGGGGERESSAAVPEAEEEMELLEHYKALTVELEAKIEVLVATINEKDSQMQSFKKQYDEMLACLEEKENKLADLEFELLCSETADSSARQRERELEQKDKQIETLSEDLRKCTCHLQEIVNKELWDKNKEIEKLHTKYGGTASQQKLIAELREEKERSERLRRESNEVCCLLSSRLEELATFLDSLLQHQSVLGFLGLQKEKRLRGLVNSSLDISKSFATSLMAPGEQSLAQLSNITALLEGSAEPPPPPQESFLVVPADATLTYRSHLVADNESVVGALREQIVNLKTELRLRDNELNKLNDPSKGGAPSSESEGWSEPDRTVSRARIGLSGDARAGDAPESTEEEEGESACSLTPGKRRGLDGYELREEVRRKSEALAGKEAEIKQLLDAVEEAREQQRLAEAGHEEELRRLRADYVERSELEAKVLRIEQLLAETDELRGALSAREAENSRQQDVVDGLRKELDALALQHSEAVLERTRLAGAKAELEAANAGCQARIGELQRQKSQLEVRSSELEAANAQLHNRLVKVQAGRGPMRPLPVEVERREANSSPDLGIESDHGRFSSLEAPASNVPRPLLQTLELTESMSNLLDGENIENVKFCESEQCCRRTSAFAQENADLKRKLLRMRHALEETATQLNLANQRKKQVEKVICKQIHKTSQVLKKAKANLDSGSESDLLNK